MKITYYGHSCFGVEINGKHILFDPFITPNELAKNIDVTKVPADYILISHGHYDHIADAVDIAKRTGAKVVSNYEIITWLNKQGVENTHPMNIGGKWKFDFGNVKCVAAVHSSTMPDGSSGGSPMGFVIESSKGNFYYAGDTALTYDMKLIGDYRHIDFSFLPIGDNFTMVVDNAIIATDFINCKKVIGMHYDTFGYIKIDKPEAIQKSKNAGVELILFEIGETKTIGK
jgi:L-ascorbate metabolism protein UlaG (beta-lactamase superfamily)